MLRHTILAGFCLSLVSPVSRPAQAQMAAYCQGYIQVASFQARVAPGGNVSYQATMQNVTARTQNILITVLQPLKAATTSLTLTAHGTRVVEIGTQVLQSGQQPLHFDQAAEHMVLRCQ